MDKGLLKTKTTLLKDKKGSNASLVIFDLPILIKKLKHKNRWDENDLNSMVLLKNLNEQIVLTALHEGTEIKSFQSDDSIIFQIIEGKVMFHTRKESAIINSGQLLTLNTKIKYSLTTKEETVLLLTIAGSKLQTATI